MRPLNTRERRIQFFRFLALFLLAVLPVVVLTWLFGRVDNAENDFLRAKYTRNMEHSNATNLYLSKLGAMRDQAHRLRDFVTSKSSAMEKLTCSEMGELTSELGDLEVSVQNFKDMVEESDKKDSSLWVIARDFHFATQRLATVYDKACAKQQALNEQLAENEKELEKVNKALADAQEKIMQYQNAH